jgi:hypothetical protein
MTDIQVLQDFQERPGRHCLVSVRMIKLAFRDIQVADTDTDSGIGSVFRIKVIDAALAGGEKLLAYRNGLQQTVPRCADSSYLPDLSYNVSTGSSETVNNGWHEGGPVTA